MTTLADQIAEIRREQKMRQQVWQTIPGTSKTMFLKNDHQRYYDRITDTLALLENMTPAEFNAITDRIFRKEIENSAQIQIDFQ